VNNRRFRRTSGIQRHLTGASVRISIGPTGATVAWWLRGQTYSLKCQFAHHKLEPEAQRWEAWATRLPYIGHMGLLRSALHTSEGLHRIYVIYSQLLTSADVSSHVILSSSTHVQPSAILLLHGLLNTLMFKKNWHNKYETPNESGVPTLWNITPCRQKSTTYIKPCSPIAGYRLRAVAARGNIRCFASQSRYHVATRGRTNTAARELGECRAKSDRFFVPRQRNFSVLCSFSWDGLMAEEQRRSTAARGSRAQSIPSLTHISPTCTLLLAWLNLRRWRRRQ
jgi:hypothetical protein